MAGESRTIEATRRVFLSGAAATGAAMLLAPAVRAVEVARLGPRSVHVISDGGFVLPLSALARGVPPDELAALLKAEGLPTEEVRTVLNVTLVKDGEDWTILDCGAGANFLPDSGKLAANLEAAGIDRERVKRVLFTHAHPDHLWGAIDEFDTDLFPNARYHISEREFAFWSAAEVYSKLPEDRHFFAAGAQRILKAIGEKLERFAAGMEVAPGILAVDTAGHTPGHVAFEVAGNGGSMMVLGDALTHPIVSFRYPDWRTISDTDPDHGVATRWRLLDELASRRLPIIGYHLPTPGLGRVERAGSAFRFVAG